ncbi:MAG: TolB family protein, partial [Gaiellaceae bacterium]
GIWVMNADGTGRRRLTTRPGDGEPTWSPDGRRIAYRSSSATSFDLWVVPSTGGTRRPLLRTIWVLTLSTGHARRVTRGGASFSPDWASDGRRIAFATGGRIAVVDTVARRQRILPSGSPRSADDPAWSPDSRRIAFQLGGKVLTMRAQDGGDRRYVTRASWGTNGEPDW